MATFLEESSKEPEGQRQGTELKRCLCLAFQMLQAWVWLAILKGLVYFYNYMKNDKPLKKSALLIFCIGCYRIQNFLAMFKICRPLNRFVYLRLCFNQRKTDRFNAQVQIIENGLKEGMPAEYLNEQFRILVSM